jgi:hypothetical protein
MGCYGSGITTKNFSIALSQTETPRKKYEHNTHC